MTSLFAVMLTSLVLTYCRAVDNIHSRNILTVKVGLNTVLATPRFCLVWNNAETIDIDDRRLVMRLRDVRYRRQGQGSSSTGHSVVDDVVRRPFRAPAIISCYYCS